MSTPKRSRISRPVPRRRRTDMDWRTPAEIESKEQYVDFEMKRSLPSLKGTRLEKEMRAIWTSNQLSPMEMQVALLGLYQRALFRVTLSERSYIALKIRYIGSLMQRFHEPLRRKITISNPRVHHLPDRRRLVDKHDWRKEGWIEAKKKHVSDTIERNLPSLKGTPLEEKMRAIQTSIHFSQLERQVALLGIYHEAIYFVKPNEREYIASWVRRVGNLLSKNTSPLNRRKP